MNKTKLPEAGEVVVLDFPGVTGTKRRPAVIVSSDLYHKERPDVIVGLITSQIGSATAATDYLLRDWEVAGLRLPSAFRAFADYGSTVGYYGSGRKAIRIRLASSARTNHSCDDVGLSIS